MPIDSLKNFPDAAPDPNLACWADACFSAGEVFARYRPRIHAHYISLEISRHRTAYNVLMADLAAFTTLLRQEYLASLLPTTAQLQTLPATYPGFEALIDSLWQAYYQGFTGWYQTNILTGNQNFPFSGIVSFKGVHHVWHILSAFKFITEIWLPRIPPSLSATPGVGVAPYFNELMYIKLKNQLSARAFSRELRKMHAWIYDRNISKEPGFWITPEGEDDSFKALRRQFKGSGPLLAHILNHTGKLALAPLSDLPRSTYIAIRIPVKELKEALTPNIFMGFNYFFFRPALAAAWNDGWGRTVNLDTFRSGWREAYTTNLEFTDSMEIYPLDPCGPIHKNLDLKNTPNTFFTRYWNTLQEWIL